MRKDKDLEHKHRRCDEYGKLVVFDVDESGKRIGEKLFVVLSEKQKKELVEFILDTSNSLEENHYSKNHTLQKLKQPFTERTVGNLYICIEQKVVCVRGQDVHLTVKEFDLLALLIMHPKRVFTYEMIMDLVWHEDYTFYSRKAVNNHVSNLRKKLKIAPDIPDYIKSVYGVGYKFEV